MQDFARSFYKGQAWQRCRKGYAQSVGGLCENCLRAGRYTPGEIVHHKIHITRQNIYNPEITLSWDNLELLCRDCHGQEHSNRVRRYKVDEIGNLIID